MIKCRVLAPVAAALLALGAPAVAQGVQPVKLAEEALKLDVRFEGKMTTGAKVDTQLRPLVRQALNEWAAVAARLDLDVTVPKTADALILGRAPEATLIEAAQWIDKTGALFEGLKPSAVGVEDARPPHAIVVALFDEQGFKSEAWPGLLDTLVARKDLLPAFAEQMKRDPGSFTARNASFFAQHTFDIAGNAENGDDEYRFANEIVHKTAQYLVEARFGRQPDVVRWGIGYVAEQRLRGAIYQFNAPASWPRTTTSAGRRRRATCWPTRARRRVLARRHDPAHGRGGHARVRAAGRLGHAGVRAVQGAAEAGRAAGPARRAGQGSRPARDQPRILRRRAARARSLRRHVGPAQADGAGGLPEEDEVGGGARRRARSRGAAATR